MDTHSVLKRHETVSKFMKNDEGEDRKEEDQSKKKMTEAAARLDTPMKNNPEQEDSERGMNSHRDTVKCEDGV